MFQDGTLNIDTREPIRVDELEGKYYISGDGRHRVAALKLLDVDSIPALVTKIRKK
jgi:ParB-like chromosome segregation protein Spo0J